MATSAKISPFSDYYDATFDKDNPRCCPPLCHVYWETVFQATFIRRVRYKVNFVVPVFAFQGIQTSGVRGCDNRSLSARGKVDSGLDLGPILPAPNLSFVQNILLGFVNGNCGKIMLQTGCGNWIATLSTSVSIMRISALISLASLELARSLVYHSLDSV